MTTHTSVSDKVRLVNLLSEEGQWLSCSKNFQLQFWNDKFGETALCLLRNLEPFVGARGRSSWRSRDS